MPELGHDVVDDHRVLGTLVLPSAKRNTIKSSWQNSARVQKNDVRSERLLTSATARSDPGRGGANRPTDPKGWAGSPSAR